MQVQHEHGTATWLTASAARANAMMQQETTGILLYCWWNISKECNRHIYESIQRNAYQVALFVKRKLIFISWQSGMRCLNSWCSSGRTIWLMLSGASILDSGFCSLLLGAGLPTDRGCRASQRPFFFPSAVSRCRSYLAGRVLLRCRLLQAAVFGRWTASPCLGAGRLPLSAVGDRLCGISFCLCILLVFAAVLLPSFSLFFRLLFSSVFRRCFPFPLISGC
jgi:hypothetical protein